MRYVDVHRSIYSISVIQFLAMMSRSSLPSLVADIGPLPDASPLGIGCQGGLADLRRCRQPRLSEVAEQDGRRHAELVRQTGRPTARRVAQLGGRAVRRVAERSIVVVVDQRPGVQQSSAENKQQHIRSGSHRGACRRNRRRAVRRLPRRERNLQVGDQPSSLARARTARRRPRKYPSWSVMALANWTVAGAAGIQAQRYAPFHLAPMA